MKRTMFLILAIMLIGFAALTYARLGSDWSIAQDSNLRDHATNLNGAVATYAKSSEAIGSYTPQTKPVANNNGFNLGPPKHKTPLPPSLGSQSQVAKPNRRQTNIPSGNQSSFGAPAQIHSPLKIPASRFAQIKYPPNANQVENLVRAQYLLPAEAAENLEKLFAFDEAGKVETRISESEIESMVMLQVTTDSKTQQATAEFLNAIYPKDRVQAISDSKADGTEQTSVRATDSSIQTVKLKLPGMT